MKINKKFVIILALLAAGGIWAFNAWRPKVPVYKTEKVVRANMVQEVSETGAVKKGQVLNLSFKNSGVISKINVAKGDEVKAGDVLAELDSRQLQVQLEQARANLNLYDLQLEKLQKGASAEEVSIVQSQAQAAQIARDSARQSLADARDSAGQKLNSAYKSASDALSSAYAKAYNAYNFSDLLQRTYFTPRDQDSISVWETAQKMNVAVAQIKNYSNTAAADGKDNESDPIFNGAKIQLAAVESDLREIRAMCEKTPWRDTVVQAYKDELDLHIGYVVAAQSSFNLAVENIALQKSANDLAVNSAQAAVDAAQAAAKTADDQLARTMAAARSEDVGVFESQIAQAKAQIDLLELQIGDSRLISPVAGQVAAVNASAGETVSLLSAAGLVVILPADPYTVEADIYEEDAAKVVAGDPVTISVAALPDRQFLGNVVSIDPSGKLINGVVYYTTKIAFTEPPVNLKPEMTADVVIVAATRDNVLQISETALQKKPDGSYFVQILKNGQPQDAPVQIGIKSKGMVEIISGLNEGEEIIIP